MINIAERHKFILDKLYEKGYISVVDLCKELDVSGVTIRKDLKLLEDDASGMIGAGQAETEKGSK